MNLVAKEGCCEEESMFAPIPGVYFPCNQPATTAVYHKRDDMIYRMCDMCADHNVRNRGGEEV